MDLVIVTGAGASRELGDPDPLPLMADWSNRLTDALNAEDDGLAGRRALSPDCLVKNLRRRLVHY
jgi:hypothetical protein